jgi:hypothetical protein
MYAATTRDQSRRGTTTGKTRRGARTLRRQIHDRRLAPAGSSRAERLDPFTLPVRFSVADTTADERMRFVELSCERVVLRRAVAGIDMALNLPIAAYLGIAIRMEPPDGEAPGAVTVVLEHRDPSLSLPLFRAGDGNDIVAEWQSWARVLKLPLLVAESDGRLREPFQRVGSVRAGTPCPRRRRRSAIKARRPSMMLRRKPGRSIARASVHRDEREIIARN